MTMSATKSKTSSPNVSFTSVILSDSPGASTSKNLTGTPRVIRDIAADIYNNIQHWNTLHINGASIVKEVALLKSDTAELYPNGLEKLIQNVYEIITGLKIVIDSIELSMRQLKSAVKLHKSITPLFISWPVEKISNTGERIYEAYLQEFELKKFIAENIAHVQGRNKLMFYAASWTYQPYITDDITLLLESFLTETGHRNK